jgi:hypothetical protein
MKNKANECIILGSSESSKTSLWYEQWRAA